MVCFLAHATLENPLLPPLMAKESPHRTCLNYVAQCRGIQYPILPWLVAHKDYVHQK
jgi:hypothetical protein